jgi:ubiquinol-cytochrome c reductase subunit 7
LPKQDVEEALHRLPKEEVDARNQRLKRGADMSLKRDYLPAELQKLQTPFLFYIKVCAAVSNRYDIVHVVIL